MASGDLKFERSNTGTLTNPQRASLADILRQLWSGALTDLNQVTFHRNSDNTVTYSLHGEETATTLAALPVGCVVKSRVP